MKREVEDTAEKLAWTVLNIVFAIGFGIGGAWPLVAICAAFGAFYGYQFWRAQWP